MHRQSFFKYHFNKSRGKKFDFLLLVIFVEGVGLPYEDTFVGIF